MEFTPEEREEIDRELALVEEVQRRNGNKIYTFDEVVTEVYSDLGLKLEDFYEQLHNKYYRDC